MFGMSFTPFYHLYLESIQVVECLELAVSYGAQTGARTSAATSNCGADLLEALTHKSLWFI